MEKIKDTSQIIEKKLDFIYFKQDLKSLLLKIIFIAIALLLINKFVFTFHVVSNNYMSPSIRDGDLALVYKLENEFAINDVVVIDKNQKKYVSRIIAKPGDTVDISDEGKVILNGNIIDEENIYFDTYSSNNVEFPIKLNENEFFVLGDMRLKAIDSRDFGIVKLDEIAGKIIYIYRSRSL